MLVWVKQGTKFVSWKLILSTYFCYFINFKDLGFFRGSAYSCEKSLSAIHVLRCDSTVQLWGSKHNSKGSSFTGCTWKRERHGINVDLVPFLQWCWLGHPGILWYSCSCTASHPPPSIWAQQPQLLRDMRSLHYCWPASQAHGQHTMYHRPCPCPQEPELDLCHSACSHATAQCEPWGWAHPANSAAGLQQAPTLCWGLSPTEAQQETKLPAPHPLRQICCKGRKQTQRQA